MVKLRDFDAAVFDMDGTLTTTMEIWDRLVDNFVLHKGKTPERGFVRRYWHWT